MERIPGPLAESMPLRLKCSSGETIQKSEELSIGIGVGTYLMLVVFPETLVEAGGGGGGGGLMNSCGIHTLSTIFSLGLVPGLPHFPF